VINVVCAVNNALIAWSTQLPVYYDFFFFYTTYLIIIKYSAEKVKAGGEWCVRIVKKNESILAIERVASWQSRRTCGFIFAFPFLALRPLSFIQDDFFVFLSYGLVFFSSFNGSLNTINNSFVCHS